MVTPSDHATVSAAKALLLASAAGGLLAFRRRSPVVILREVHTLTPLAVGHVARLESTPSTSG
jgi:hypothetical protein